MNLRSFYELLLPRVGRYALFHVPTKRHLWCGSLDELVYKTETSGTATHSWYFAVGSFQSDGRTQANALAKRALYLDIDAGAAKYEKDPANAYETADAALAALVAFSTSTGLVPSLVVSSGAGIHVYYALDADATPTAWQVVADQLKTAAKLCGLKADPTCTSDSARVLRPLGALHKNGATVRLLKATGKVWSLAELQAKIEPLVPAVAAPLPTRRFENAADINDEALGGPSAPSSALEIVKSCGALAEVAASRGNCAEPMWRAMIGLVKHCVEGADLVHQWSDGYDGYSFDETQEKFDRYHAGPTTCAKFAEHSSACKTCAHQGNIKSPIVLGRIEPQQPEPASAPQQPEPTPAPPAPVAEAAEPVLQPAPDPDPSPAADTIPDGFRVVREGTTQVLQYRKEITAEDDDGITIKSAMWVTFASPALWFTEWSDAGRGTGENSKAKVSRARLPQSSAIHDRDFDPKLCADRKGLEQELLDLGVNLIGGEVATRQIMQNYVNESLRRLRSRRPRPVLRKRFGFQFDSGGKFVFAQGSLVLRGDGIIQKAIVSSNLPSEPPMGLACLPPADGYEWPAAVWKTHIMPAARRQVEFYRRWFGHDNAKVSQLVLTLQLAAPLMCFLGDTLPAPDAPLPAVGAVVSLYSAQGGRGKTSVMSAGAAAYGNPANIVAQGGSNGMTHNGFLGRAECTGTGMLCADEVTDLGPRAAAAIINDIANGTGKIRAKQDGSSREPQKFSLIGFVSTNTPQRDLLAAQQGSSDALQLRLLELNFDAQPPIDGSFTGYAGAFKEDMMPNYGALGAVVALYCLAQGPERMGRLMTEAMEEAARLLGAQANERFLVRLLACLLRVQAILLAYRLAPFEIASLVEQFRLALDTTRNYTRSVAVTGTDLLRKMMVDLSPHFLATQTESFTSERADVLENGHTFRPPVKGRQVRNGRFTYLGADAMKAWCKDNSVSYSQLVSDAQRDGVFLQLPSGKLLDMVLVTRGVSHVAAVRMPCYKINDAVLYGQEEGGGNVVDMRRETTPAPPARKEAK
jgi:hypothetical protein